MVPNDTNSLLAALNHDGACREQNGLTSCGG